MAYLLSLDGSTSVVGYSIWNKDTGELKEMNYLKLEKGNLLEKADEFELLLLKLKDKYSNLQEMVIEEAMMAMFGGMSSSHTTTILNQMNILYQYVCRKNGLETSTMTVQACRKNAFPTVKLRAKKLAGGLNHKEQMFLVVTKTLGEDKFPTKVLQSGKNKGNTVFLDEAKDMADSYVVGLGFLNKRKNESKHEKNVELR
jgi:hypothetical protein